MDNAASDQRSIEDIFLDYTECQRERDALAEALEMVEFIPYTTFCGNKPTTEDTCMWCGGEEKTGHETDCPRQVALALLDE